MKIKIFLATTLVCILLTIMSFTLSKNQHVKHIVVFKFKSSASAAQITEVTNAFKDLKNKIPGIVSFEYGTNNSPENLNKGYTHIYLLTFENVAMRDAYLPHPDHKKFGDLLTKLNVVEEKPFVVDFQSEE